MKEQRGIAKNFPCEGLVGLMCMMLIFLLEMPQKGLCQLRDQVRKWGWIFSKLLTMSNLCAEAHVRFKDMIFL